MPPVLGSGSSGPTLSVLGAAACGLEYKSYFAHVCGFIWSYTTLHIM